MTKDNDLVKKLRKRQEFEFIDGYKRIEWEDDDALEAADRIEALHKAITALQKVRDFVRDLGPYADQWHTLAPALHDACVILNELEGSKT